MNDAHARLGSASNCGVCHETRAPTDPPSRNPASRAVQTRTGRSVPVAAGKLARTEPPGIGARFAHALKRRSRCVMMAGCGHRAISADMVVNLAASWADCTEPERMFCAPAIARTAASGLSISHRVRPDARSRPVTQARVMVVSPNEAPKVAGLRSDTGPCHAPPTTSHAASWPGQPASARHRPGRRTAAQAPPGAAGAALSLEHDVPPGLGGRTARGPALPAAPAWLAGAAVRKCGRRRGLLVSFKWDASEPIRRWLPAVGDSMGRPPRPASASRRSRGPQIHSRGP